MDLFAPNHILLILLVVLLLFGGKKIPELMRGLGKGIREFNDAKNNVRKEVEDSIAEKERQQQQAAATSQSTTTTSTTPQP
ncbi:MAG: twin-arginine translocase TatA/TatE family subunit [Flavisolibacter sp.]|jgi:sec-independent protein translocase protein TatA